MATPTVRDAGIIDVSCGGRVTIVRPANLYGCVLGDDAFVGPFVEIQRGARIGARTRVHSHAFICEMVTIGSDCFISHSANFVNDLFSRGRPARGGRSLWRPTLVGNRVSIGTNATVLPVTIGDDVEVGAGAVVTKSLERPGIYAGAPACLIRPLP